MLAVRNALLGFLGFLRVYKTLYWSGWKNALRFQGRASRGEYVAFMGTHFLLYFVLLPININGFTPGGFILPVLGLLLFIPNLSLTWRRLHDVGLSGRWALLLLIPLVNLVLILLLSLWKGKKD